MTTWTWGWKREIVDSLLDWIRRAFEFTDADDFLTIIGRTVCQRRTFVICVQS